VEIVARVYRAIFDPFLRRRLTTRCIPPSPPPRRRRRFSFPFPLPAASSCRNSLQQHSRPSPSIIYHFETSKMLLSTSALEKFHPQSLQRLGSASALMKFGDDPKLPRRIRVPSSALSMIRVTAL